MQEAPKASKAESKKIEAKAAAKKSSNVSEKTKKSDETPVAKNEKKALAKKAAKKSTTKESDGFSEAKVEEIVYKTDSQGNRLCRASGCDQIAQVDGYCRYHYLLLWKKIQLRRKILSEGKLEKYIQDLTARYPDKYLEILRKDLKSEKDFLAAVQELEIDDSGVDSEYEDEAQSFIEEVRGVADSGSGRDDDDY